MIKIDGRLVTELTFENFAGLTLGNFGYVKILESAGLSPPLVEIRLNQSNLNLYTTLVKLNLPLKLSYGTSTSDLTEANLVLVDYEYISEPSGYGLLLIATLDIQKFRAISEITSTVGTSADALRTLKHLSLDINYQSDDSQTWIRPNISERDFLERTLLHSYISDSDFVSSAITIESELRLLSTKSIFESNPKITLINRGVNRAGEVSFGDYGIKSNSSATSQFLSEGKTLNVVKLKGREDTSQNHSMTSVGGSDIQESWSNTPYPPQLDNGNCHENYYKARVANLSFYSQIIRNQVDVPLTNTIFLTNNKLKLLDCVAFLPSDPSRVEMAHPLSGNYLLMTKETYFDQKTVHIGLGLVRDTYV